MNKIIKLEEHELRLLQLNELSLLLELDRICRKNNIDYTLAGGTLIGAIRHKGFIPWDDDVDVRFKRDQYERFFEACKTDLDTNRYFLQDYRTDENYRWGYSKMRLNDTEYIRAGQEHMRYRTGVCIDIFITDNVPDTKIGRKILWYETFCIRKILYSELGMVAEKNMIMRIWYRFLYRIIPRSSCFKILKKIEEKNNKNNTIGGRTYTWYEPDMNYNYVMYNYYFDDYIDAEFEGFRLKITKEYDKYLKQFYGDYMIIPPKEKRVLSGPASTIKLKDITIEQLRKEYGK